MEHKNFDKLIRSKLESIEPELPAQAWDLFADKLNIDENAGPDDSDAIYQEKLSNLSTDIPANAWSIFQEKMVLDEILTDEPADAFDLAIKDKIEHVEIAAAAGSWALFEEKLVLEETISTETIDDLHVDALAYETLNNFEAPYNPEHWTMMERRLDEDDSLLGILFRYKIAEAALILLALITFNQYFSIQDTINAIANSAITSKDVSSSTVDNTSTVLEENAFTTAEAENKGTGLGLGSSTSVNKGTGLQGNNLNVAKANLLAANFSSQSAVANQITGNNSANTHNSTTLNLTDKAENLAKEEISEIQIVVEEEYTPEKIIIPFARGVDLETAQLAYEEEEDLPNCDLCKKKFLQKPYLRVGMFSAFDLNYVMVPYDNIFDVVSDNRFGLGYGNGLSFGLRMGKWELETGAIYSNKSYLPPRVSSIEGSFTDGYYTDVLEKVRLGVLNIPLNLKYSFKNSEKWSFYGMGGSNLNLLLTTQYDRSQQFHQGGRGYTAKVQKINSAELSKKSYNDGLIEGGGLTQNHYYTLNLGLGFERHISPRWSLFTQTNYQHQLFSGGIGPNNDRINSLSILGGAKVSFRKK